VGPQGGICDGAADSFGTNDERHRSDASRRNSPSQRHRRAAEASAGDATDSAAIQLNDYFEFLVGEGREDLDGAPEGGSRYPVDARMDGRGFARFHVDVGIGDEVLEPLDVVEGRDWLGFGGIAPPSFPVISREQQFAEKVHAYSLPRGDRVNTRTKDLIDMLLLIRHGNLDNSRLAAAMKATFAKRATHPCPGRSNRRPRSGNRSSKR